MIYYKKAWVFILLLLIVALAACWYIEINSRTFQFFGGIVNRVETNKKIIALTFDDGPSSYTKEVIDILDKHRIHATFFLVGQELEHNMEMGKMLVRAGEEIANHSYTHNRLVFTTPATIKMEIDKTDSLIRAADYAGEIFFRPPGCKKFIFLSRYLHIHKRTTITWDIEPESYKTVRQNDSTITAYVVEHTKPGSIILLHVMTKAGAASRNALDGIITRLKRKGYTFVTVSELLSYRAG